MSKSRRFQVRRDRRKAKQSKFRRAGKKNMGSKVGHSGGLRGFKP